MCQYCPITIALWYIDEQSKHNKRLLKVDEIPWRTGVGKTKIICETIAKNEIELQNMTFQSYDYASSKSGEHKGAQIKRL